MEEEWGDVLGYEGIYVVNKIGDVKKLQRKGVLHEKILSTHLTKGEVRVKMRTKSSERHVHVKILVAETFLGFKRGHGILKKVVDDPLNNSVSNLYVEKKTKFNNLIINESRKKGAIALETVDLDLLIGHSLKYLAIKYNVSKGTVSNVLTNRMSKRVFTNEVEIIEVDELGVYYDKNSLKIDGLWMDSKERENMYN